MVGLCCSIRGQDVPKRGWLKTNPFGLFVGQFQCGFERPVSDRFSVQLTGGVVRSSLELNTDDLESLLSINTSLNAVDWIGVVAMPEVRYYLSENMGVGKGFYIGAFARVRSIQRTMTTNFVGVQPARRWGQAVSLAGSSPSVSMSGETSSSVPRSNRRPPPSASTSCTLRKNGCRGFASA